MPAPTRLGVVRYLNTLPLIEGLEKLPDLQLLPAPPAELADGLRRGDTDLALISVIDAMRPANGGPGASLGSESSHEATKPRSHEGPTKIDAHQTPDPRPQTQDPLTLLPVGMIASAGPTLTVRLVSRVPFNEISTLTADDESHTSIALARIILRETRGIDPKIHPRKAADWLEDPIARRSVESALLIGDKVVAAPPLDDFPHQLDLGEQWKRLTTLPFVYAMWACRPADQTSQPIQRAATLLDRQIRRNLRRLPWLAQTRAEAFGWPQPLAQQYLCELLRFRTDASAIEGLMAFAQRCEALKLGTAPQVAYEWIDKTGSIAR